MSLYKLEDLKINPFIFISFVIFLCIFFISSLFVYSGLYIGYILISALLGLYWIAYCVRTPLLSFFIVLFVFVLVYARLNIGFVEVEGSGNRGDIALGDALWVGLIIGWFIKLLLTKKLFHLKLDYPMVVWAMCPFVLMGFLFPIIGIIIGDWPISYSAPALRQIQWVSFAVLAYWLCMNYNIRNVIVGLLKVIILAGVIHVIYSLIQLGVYNNLLDSCWIYLDELFASHNDNAWFYYPRVTGLFVNPNSYGMYCAFLFVAVTVMCRMRLFVKWKLLFWWLALLVAFLGLAFSGSRSAMLGLMFAFSILGLLVLISSSLLRRAMLFVSGMTAMGFVVIPITVLMMPIRLKERFIRFVEVFIYGVGSDTNAVGRVEHWNTLWNTYLSDYPLGTWVPPSYATGIPVDNFYISTTLQGTPIYTMTWLIFMFSTILLGIRTYNRTNLLLGKTVALSLVGWAGVMLGSGFTLSPMLQPQLIVPFWTIIGINLAINKLYTSYRSTNLELDSCNC